MNDNIEKIKLLFSAEATIERLPGAGSNREYYRLSPADGSATLIGVVGTSREENHAFITLARHFREKGLPVPEVLKVSADETAYLQQDLGPTALFDVLKNSRATGCYTAEETALLEKNIRLLAHIQVEGAKDLDFAVCYPQPEFDRRNVMFDLNYFKYSFLKATGVDFHELLLEDDFCSLADNLLEEQLTGFMYRDFQARNVMLVDGNPYFIDFQGGRRGPLLYDVASFLYQASARYPQQLRDHLVGAYYDELQSLTAVAPFGHFSRRLNLFVLFRTLQVLGAYGFRGYFERKPHFLNSIPPALENLRQLLQTGVCDAFPHLKTVCQKLIGTIPTSTPSLPCSGSPSPSRLTVRISSFSYKKGIPQDPSGNGGGYVFDCRSTNNPGRYEEYKNLTGLDQPVIDFLEKDGEIIHFLDNIYPLVDFHVQRWLDRGFTDLQVSFGCTGGQHRSVYSAQHVADHLREKFGNLINLLLTHREQRPQAFILAAGLGTRLKPLTDTRPKALVRVSGKTLLERTIETLETAGFQNIVVNAHHFAEQIKAFVKDYKDSKGLKDPNAITLCISDETDALLDTGGGLLKARHKFSQARPVLIHNVDILSNADLKSLYKSHLSATVAAASATSPAIATLLVSRRETSRYLHFDEESNLIGWQNTKTGEVKGRLGTPLAFSGIHIISPHIFPLLESYAQEISPSFVETKQIPKFSITDFYLWACTRAKIKAYIQEDLNLTDVGKLAVLEQLNQK